MSRQRECPSCASMVPAKSRQCSVCGYEFPGSPLRQSGRAILAVILVAVFLIPLIWAVIHALD
ncbi:MAG TPA: zinc ribbon domain-containing protein [Acidobacteriota bacterium]|nr:zinc ribbon domain-containing protein [Acidobacteriota bacterium]